MNLNFRTTNLTSLRIMELSSRIGVSAVSAVAVRAACERDRRSLLLLDDDPSRASRVAGDLQWLKGESSLGPRFRLRRFAGGVTAHGMLL